MIKFYPLLKALIKISIKSQSNKSSSSMQMESSFQKVDLVSQPGEFAIRGSIIDVFSYGDNQPYRIDFFGDEIESIKVFNTNTQRSEKIVESIDIFPNIASSLESQYTVPVLNFLPQESVIWLADVENIQDYSSPHKHIFISTLGNESINVEKTVTFKTSPQPTFNKHFEILADDIRAKREDGYSVYILSESISQIERLKSIFYTHNLVLNYESYTIQEE